MGEGEAKSGWSQEREFFGSAEPKKNSPVIARVPFSQLRIPSSRFLVGFCCIGGLSNFVISFRLLIRLLPCSALSGAGRGRAANVFPDSNHEPSRAPLRKPPDSTPITFQQIIAHRERMSMTRHYAVYLTRNSSGRSFRTSAVRCPSGQGWFRTNT
jgi:hypothetical protein